MLTATGVKISIEIVALSGALGCATANRDIGADRAPIHSSSTLMTRDDALRPPPIRAADVLTAQEVAAASGLVGATGYDAVIRLRAHFLHPRDARTSAIAARGMLPAIFVNGIYYGEADVLRLLAISAIEELQYVRSFDAMHRYGSEYRAGVILVRLKRGVAPQR